MRAPSLGARGEGWVWIQFAVMALVVVLGIVGPAWFSAVNRALDVVGVVLLLAGIALGVWAGRTLGGSFTPFPEPSSDGHLVEAGPYAVVRHPVYAAGLCVFGAVALVLSPVALVPVAALAVVWALKASVEERFLLDRYPDYAAYRERVRARIVPGVY